MEQVLKDLSIKEFEEKEAAEWLEKNEKQEDEENEKYEKGTIHKLQKLKKKFLQIQIGSGCLYVINQGPFLDLAKL